MGYRRVCVFQLKVNPVNTSTRKHRKCSSWGRCYTINSHLHSTRFPSEPPDEVYILPIGHLCSLLKKEHAILLYSLCDSTVAGTCVTKESERDKCCSWRSTRQTHRCGNDLCVADGAIVTFSRQIFPLKSRRDLYGRIVVLAAEEGTFISIVSPVQQHSSSHKWQGGVGTRYRSWRSTLQRTDKDRRPKV